MIENGSENIPISIEDHNPDFLGIFYQKDFTAYIGAAIYGYWENARAFGFDIPGVIDDFKPGEMVRATEGINKLFDQNTGDGTIVALGFLGAELLSLSINKAAIKLGKKGFDPKIRFLTSLAFGVGFATYLETTHFMNNTIDIPGDLFGVGLSAAFILTSKLAAEHITEANITKLSKQTKQFIHSAPKKFQNFSEEITNKLRDINNQHEEESSESIAQTLHDLADEYCQDDSNINPSI